MTKKEKKAAKVAYKSSEQIAWMIYSANRCRGLTLSYLWKEQRRTYNASPKHSRCAIRSYMQRRASWY